MTAAVSTQPYLIRAIHEWCVDQGFTPYVVVQVDGDVVVPQGYARDGQIVLNLAPDATHRLSIGDEGIGFQARFGGVAHDLWLPYPNVLAIYARENGRGLAFSQGLAFELNPNVESGADETPADEAEVDIEAEEQVDPPQPLPPDEPPPKGGRSGHLKVIK